MEKRGKLCQGMSHQCYIRLEATTSYEIDGVVLPHGSSPRQKRASCRLVTSSIPRHPARLVHLSSWTTQVMSRQGKEPESQIVLKRPRHEDRLAQHSSSMSIPSSITPSVHGIDIVPAIRGVQDHMSSWMSSLIHAQDGCLQMVAQRASMGRVQQEQLAQQVAQHSMMPSMTDQLSYLRAQLAHRDAQLEQVRAERDNHFVQEEEVLAHMRLLSSEAKDWKSRVVTDVEEVLCRESAQAAQQATEAQEAMDQHYKIKWRQAEADLKAKHIYPTRNPMSIQQRPRAVSCNQAA